MRGAKVAIGQTVPLMKGLVGLAGATAEEAFGAGGIATGVKNWGLSGFTQGMERLRPLQKETDELTTAWDRAKEGDLGALVDWAQYGLGYAIGQGGETIATAVLGGLAGAAAAPAAAPVTAVGGAITGLVAKGAVKEAATSLIRQAVLKEANTLMKGAAGKMTAEQAVKQATKSIASDIGATSALLAYGSAQSLGSIYPEAEAEAIRSGRELDGSDLARVWATGIASGAFEGVTDKLGIGALTGKIRIPGAGRVGSAAAAGLGGAVLEGATEAVQTGIERFGAGKEVLSDEGQREIINAAGLGAVGGGAIGGGIGLLRGPSDALADDAFQRIAEAPTVDDAIKAFTETRVPLEVPAGLDVEGAMARLERENQRTEQSMRDFSQERSSASLVAAPSGDQQPAVQAAQPAEPSAEVVPPEPFLDRLLTIRDQLKDSRLRQQIRDELGPEALSDVLYYVQQADNADLPGVTSDRMLQVAESIVSRAQFRPIPNQPQTVAPAQAPQIAAAQAPEVPQIGLDTTPTGVMRVTPGGVAAPELRADLVSDADRARAAVPPVNTGMEGSFPQGAPVRPGVPVGPGRVVPPEPAAPPQPLALPEPEPYRQPATPEEKAAAFARAEADAENVRRSQAEAIPELARQQTARAAAVERAAQMEAPGAMQAALARAGIAAPTEAPAAVEAQPAAGRIDEAMRTANAPVTDVPASTAEPATATAGGGDIGSGGERTVGRVAADAAGRGQDTAAAPEPGVRAAQPVVPGGQRAEALSLRERAERAKQRAEPQDRQGLRAEDRRMRDVDSAAAELAGQIQEESAETDFDPKELGPVVARWAKEAGVTEGELRAATIEKIKTAPSFRRKAGAIAELGKPPLSERAKAMRERQGGAQRQGASPTSAGLAERADTMRERAAAAPAPATAPSTAPAKPQPLKERAEALKRRADKAPATPPSAPAQQPASQAPAQNQAPAATEAARTDDTAEGGSTVRMRRDESAESRQSNQRRTERVRDVVDAITDQWTNAPEVIVLDDISEASPALKQVDREARAQGGTGATQGYWEDGRVYLIASELSNDSDVVRVLFHETIGHAGLRGAFGNRLVKILDDVSTANPTRMRRKAKQYGMDLADRDQRLTVAEEILAEMSERAPNASLVQRFVAAVRQFLRDIGVRVVLSDNDIVVNFLIPARQFIVSGGGRLQRGRVARSVGKEDQTQTEAFKRWFGDSKVVDESGKPLVVYHGTHADIVQFKKTKGAHLGFHFGDAEAANTRLEDTSDDRIDKAEVERLRILSDERFAELSAFKEALRRKDGDPPIEEITAALERGEDFLPILDRYKYQPTKQELAELARLDAAYRSALLPIMKTGTGSNILPVYLSIKKPLRMPDVGNWGSAKAVREALPWSSDARTIGQVLDEMSARGYDGIVYANRVENPVMKTDSYIAFRPEQIKSAIGNRGTFDPANPDIRMSRTMDAIRDGIRGFDQTAARNLFLDATANPGKLGLWARTIGTQYAKAKQYPETFGRVFDAVQDYIKDISNFANSAAERAPNILPKLERLMDLKKGGLTRLTDATQQDLQAAGSAIFQGTLSWARDSGGKLVPIDEATAAAARMSTADKAGQLLRGNRIGEKVLKMWQGLPIDRYEEMVNGKYEREFLKAGVVFTTSELRKLGLTDTQIELYREFRSAVDQSLDDLAKSEMLRMAGADGRAVQARVLAAPTLADAAAILRTHFDELAAAAPDRKESLDKTYDAAADKSVQVDRLKQDGYAPLMRFGRHTLHITSPDGETLFFGMYESRREANRAAREMQADPQFKSAKVSRGLMSQEAYKLYSGMPLDALELFATTTGNADNEVYQDFLRLTKGNRSALKRMIHRQGIAGFSEDASRVLASFVTSNARLASGNLHLGVANEAAGAIPKEQGDLKDDAVRLVQYVQNPQEEAAAVRGLLFTNFIGGSVASAAVNLTQPLTMTLPYLSQFGGVTKASQHIMVAAKMAVSGAPDGEIGEALARAERDGIVSPQEIHHLQAEAMNRLGNHPVLKKAAFIWGSLFSLSEQFNRRVSFIAAYNTAKEQHIEDPFAFAEQAVIETQGLYNRGNRPNWARGPIGATAFTFKQFSIHYLEFLRRMWTDGGRDGKKAVGVALAILVMVAGAGGLPFADDLDDAVDTLAQALGYDFSSKAAKRRFIAETLGLGDVAADVATRGLSSLPGFPIDVSMRMGLGNLLPGTGALLRSNTDRSTDVLEFAGAAGGLAKNAMDAGAKLLSGDVARAGLTMAPVAIQNMGAALTMWSTGEYRNRRDQKVMDVGPIDAAAKFIGFQPAEVARESAAMREVQRSTQLARNVESDIAAKWARGLNDKDPEVVKEARQELADWNRRNPDTQLRITMQQVIRRVREMQRSRAERAIRSAPPELRERVREAL